jgi:outer membrane protein TolC
LLILFFLKAKAAVDGLRAELSRAQSQLKAAEDALTQVKGQTYM